MLEEWIRVPNIYIHRADKVVHSLIPPFFEAAQMILCSVKLMQDWKSSLEDNNISWTPYGLKGPAQPPAHGPQSVLAKNIQ